MTVAADHWHLFVDDDPHCKVCYQRSDAHDAVLIDLRAERAANGAPSVLRAGPVPTLTLEEAGQRPPRGQKDRPTYDPKGAA